MYHPKIEAVLEAMDEVRGWKSRYGSLHAHKVCRVFGFETPTYPARKTATAFLGPMMLVMERSQGFHSMSHRVKFICPCCAKRLSFGRFHQHIQVHQQFTFELRGENGIENLYTMYGTRKESLNYEVDMMLRFKSLTVTRIA